VATSGAPEPETHCLVVAEFLESANDQASQTHEAGPVPTALRGSG
jgi:hypothetical protein